MTLRCIIIRWFGYNNLGDELILHSLLSRLKKDSFDIFVASGNPQQTTRIHGVKSIPTDWSILRNFKKVNPTRNIATMPASNACKMNQELT